MDEFWTDKAREAFLKAAAEQAEKQAKLEQVCWFCNAQPPAEKKHWAGVHLEKVVSQSARRRVSKVLDVPVPRCESCYRIHKRMTWVIRYALIAFFAPIVLMILDIVPTDRYLWFVTAMEYLMKSGLIVALLGTLLYHITFPKHTHRRNYENQYPAVVDAKRSGFLGPGARIFHQ